MIPDIYVGPLTKPDGSRAGPQNIAGVYVLARRSDRRPIRIGQSAGCFGRVRNHALHDDGFCRQHGIDPASLFAVIVPLPGSNETWRVAVEHYLRHALS